MDTTQYYLEQIKRSNISHWRIRKIIKEINEYISGYRLLAMKSRGYLRDFCNKEANYLEGRLNDSLKGSKFETNRYA